MKMYFKRLHEKAQMPVKAEGHEADFCYDCFAVSEEDMQAKKDAMNCYEFESRKFPHPRAGESLDALAKYRGVQVGCDRAEAFQIIRHLL